MPPPALGSHTSPPPSGLGPRPRKGSQETGLPYETSFCKRSPRRVCRGKSGANRTLTGCTFPRTCKKPSPEGGLPLQPCEAHPRVSQIRSRRSLGGHRLLAPNGFLLPLGLGLLICEMRGGCALYGSLGLHLSAGVRAAGRQRAACEPDPWTWGRAAGWRPRRTGNAAGCPLQFCP